MGLKTIDLTTSKNDFIPGPGKYDIDTYINTKLKKDPSFSIGTSKRLDVQKAKDEIPGPGNYDSFNAIQNKNQPMYSFGTGTRDNSKEKKEAPGPGAYDYKQKMGEEGSKISISPKFTNSFIERESRNMPGPGSYDNTS